MAISLKKGENIPLDAGLKKIKVCLGWKERESQGEDFDLDATCFMLGSNGKVFKDQDIIFYGNLRSQCGSVQHMGDDLQGGEGDVEQIQIDLTKVPQQYAKLAFVVTIYEYDKRKQNFGMVSDAFVRLVDMEKGAPGEGEEVARFELSEDAGIETAVLFAEIYRFNGAWKFKALGEGYNFGLLEFCQKYGVHAK